MIAIPIDKPKNCNKCPFTCEKLAFFDGENRPKGCPLIDIVTCGECKHWDGIECQNDRASTDLEGGAEYALYRDDTDFCSYGERRADEHNT